MPASRSDETRSYLILHVAVILFAFSAILGDLISITSLPLVWWRVGLTCVFLWFLFGARKAVRELPKRVYIRLAYIGFLVGGHWYTFFASIKASNASVTLVCLSTTSFLTALLEPLILRQRLRKREVLLGFIIVPAMVLIVRELKGDMVSGVLLGLSSALLGAMFSIQNKKIVGIGDDFAVTFVQLGFAFLVLTILLGFNYCISPQLEVIPRGLDWFYLVLLAVGCTCLGYTLYLRSLRHLSAFTSNLTVNLEPVYGICLAAYILNDQEELSPKFYLGAMVILGTVFLHPLINLYLRRKTNMYHG